MRAHGVPSFPDPDVHSSGPGQQSVTIRVTPAIVNSPAFNTAQKACSYILPALKKGGDGETPAQQAARARDILAFARCLRAHGITNFPDPSAQGRLTLSQVAAAGVDIHSPAFRTAGDACVSAAGGLLTLDQLHQAESGGGLQ
jgi:hypothetical protein